MPWDKPKSAKGWLILAIPPSLPVLFTIAGAITDPKEGNWMGAALVGLMLSMAAAFGVSIWLARVNPTASGKIGTFLTCFILYFVINCAVSFAGCAAGSQFLPGLNFH